MDDFFTLASFATLTGSVFAVVFIVNALRHALNWGPRWFGLALSILIAFVAFHLTTSLGAHPKTAGLGWIKYLTVFVNGCFVYTSAFGIQKTVITKTAPEGELSFQGIAERETEERARISARSPW